MSYIVLCLIYGKDGPKAYLHKILGVEWLGPYEEGQSGSYKESLLI